MKTHDEKALKKFRQLVLRQDASARISFFPKQLFFGNHEMPMLPNVPMIIYQSAKNRNKVCMRVVVAQDAIVGYQQKDIGVMFNHFLKIRLIDAHATVPPAIVFTLTPQGFDKFVTYLPGLKDKITKSSNSAEWKDMMFFLGEVPGQRGAYMQYSFNDNGVPISSVLDFKEAKVVLMEDIAAVDMQHHLESVTQAKGGFTTQREKIFKEVDPVSFSDRLEQDRIAQVSNCRNGSFQATNNKNKRNVSINSPEYSKGKQVGIPCAKPNEQHIQESARIEQATRKRKMDENFNRIHSVNREVFVTVLMECAPENQYPEEEEQQLQEEEEENNVYLGLYEDPSHCENGGFVVPRKRYDQMMEYEPTLQNTNGGHHPSQFYTTPEDINYVTYGMSQVGTNWNMMLPQYANNAHHGYGGQYNMTTYNNSVQQGDNVIVTDVEQDQDTSPPEPKKPAIHDKLICFDNVEIYPKDLKTLDRKEFINDNVIEFMCKHIERGLDEDLKSRGHMISTHMYTSITTSPNLPSLCFSGRRPITEDTEALLNVRKVIRWTKDVDIFGKEYVVIPINEDLHWVVLVIFNPAGALVNMTNKKTQRISRKAPKAKFLFFDPLSGLDPSRCNHMCFIIKRWLAEVFVTYHTHKQKFDLGPNIIFDEERIEIVKPKNIPIQNNFADCGLYVIHYIEGLLCSPAGPILLKDLPTLDWSEKWPQAEKMCDLMRDKAYTLMVNACDDEARSRLAKFERVNRCGLSREKNMKKTRRHSAVPFRYTKRHPEYYARNYSVNPPSRSLINDDPMFGNPRAMASMPITQLVRELRLPEENFPLAY